MEKNSAAVTETAGFRVCEVSGARALPAGGVEAGKQKTETRKRKRETGGKGGLLARRPSYQSRVTSPPMSPTG